MIFKKNFHLRNDNIFGIEISSRNEQAMMAEERREMTVKQANSTFGHINGLQNLDTSKIKDMNKIFTYEGCHIAEAKRFAISKDPRNKSTISGERLMITVSYTYQSDGTQTEKYWLVLFDEAVGIRCLFFHTNKII
jgi:hypothetical protein